MKDIRIKPLPFRPLHIGTSKSDLMKPSQGIENFKGVFFTDEKLPRDGKLIMKLDSKKGKGTHWVAVNIDHNMYFDPFGMPPPDEIANGKSNLIKKYSSFEIQDFKEDICGEFCLYVLTHLSDSTADNVKLFLALAR